MENTKSKNWRENLKQEEADKPQTLKIADKEEVTATFVDDGIYNNSLDYGESVVFLLVKDGEKETRRFYVNYSNKVLLRQIQNLGDIEGMKVKIKRTGSKKSDTRYTIEKVV